MAHSKHLCNGSIPVLVALVLKEDLPSAESGRLPVYVWYQAGKRPYDKSLYLMEGKKDTPYHFDYLSFQGQEV